MMLCWPVHSNKFSTPISLQIKLYTQKRREPLTNEQHRFFYTLNRIATKIRIAETNQALVSTASVYKTANATISRNYKKHDFECTAMVIPTTQHISTKKKQEAKIAAIASIA
jgi:hypothetical protein